MALEVDGPRVQLRACGYTFTVRAPKLAELSAARAGDPVRGQKRLVAACVVDPQGEELHRVMLAKSGIYASLGPAIFAAFGRDSQSLEILEEFEIPDACAEAYVTNQKNNTVHALRYTRGTVAHLLLMRDLRGPEVDALLGGPSVETIRDLVVKATLWGDAKAIEGNAPALYLAIADYLATQAGVGAEVEEGEYVG